jgi:hypothetical protein
VLSSLSTGAGSKLIVVKIDSCIVTDAKNAVKELQDIHKIEKIDVVSNGESLSFLDIEHLLRELAESIVCWRVRGA